MLQLARQRRNDPRTPLVTGDMLALPFGDGRFTVVTTGYGLRNVPDLDQALREIHRVLAPGGRLLSLDFNRPGNPIVRGAYHAYLTVVGSLLGLALHGDPDTYRYIPESIRNYPGAKAVAALMTHYGFIDVRVIPVLGGLMAIHVARSLATPDSRLPTPTPAVNVGALGVGSGWALGVGVGSLAFEPGLQRGDKKLEQVVLAQLDRVSASLDRALFFDRARPARAADPSDDCRLHRRRSRARAR